MKKSEKTKLRYILRIFIIFFMFIFISCNMGDESSEENNNENNTDSELIQITKSSPQSSQNPVFSPDDKYILFTRFKNGYNKGPSEIVKINIESRKETIIVPASDFDNVNVPYGSWVENKICFASDRGGEADEIWIVNDDGTNLRQITTHSEDNEEYYIEPVFNPTNTNQIVFEYVKGENDDTAIHKIAFLDVSSGKVTLLTDGSYDDRLPSWSSDGKMILFQRNLYGRDEGWDIYVGDINTETIKITNLRKISQSNSDDTDCSWCFNGKYVLSSSNYNNIDLPNIYMFPLDTSLKPIRITFNDENEEGAPSQSHNEEWVAFESHSGEDEDTPSEIWIVKTTNN